MQGWWGFTRVAGRSLPQGQTVITRGWALGGGHRVEKIIFDYFQSFEVTLIPTNWFTMIDKLFYRIRFLKLLMPISVRLRISRINFYLDRLMPTSSRLSLFLSGCIITKIQYSDRWYKCLIVYTCEFENAWGGAKPSFEMKLTEKGNTLVEAWQKGSDVDLQKAISGSD